MPKKRYKKTEPKTLPKETKKKRRKDHKEHDKLSKTPKVDKPAIVAAPAVRRDLAKPSGYSANWKALSKQLGLQSSKRKEEIRSDVRRESKQGPHTNTGFRNRQQRKERSGQPAADPRRAKTQTRDPLLDSKSRSTRDKKASFGARKMSIKASGSQTVTTSSSQTTVTSSKKSAESKWARTGAKRQREGDGSELWFDDVEMEMVGGEPVPKRQRVSLSSGSDGSAGKYVSLDCEMVGTGPEGDFSMLARCSIVNHHGNLLYDSYVAPMDVITDYRTEYSGIRPQHLRGAPDFRTVQKAVSDLIKGRTLVGHGLHNDLKALLLSHPKKDIRDTSKYKPLRRLAKSKTPSLKKLATEILGLNIQQKQHDSIEDAQVAMKLYRLHKSEWEAALKAREATRDRRKREGVRGGDSRPGGSRRYGRRKNSATEANASQISKLNLFNPVGNASITKPLEPFNIMLHSAI